jgi:3-oxoadipate enol-lactonase
MSTDSYERGSKNRRAVLGDAWVDASIQKRNEFNADFLHYLTETVWDSIWSRPGLDHTTRRLLVLNTCIALGRWEEFELHTRAALAAQVPLETLKEAFLQSAAYAGVPAANTAFKLAEKLIREAGIELRKV